MLQHPLRILDIDDLIVLKMLLSADKLKDISKTLGITPPALSHRLRKYREYIPDFEITTTQGKWDMSDPAKIFCEKATAALSALAVVVETPTTVEG